MHVRDSTSYRYAHIPPCQRPEPLLPRLPRTGAMPALLVPVPASKRACPHGAEARGLEALYGIRSTYSFVGTKSWLLAGSKMRVKSVGGRAAAQPREGPRHGDHCCLVKNMKKQNYAPGLRRTGTTGPPEWAKASGARLWSGHQNCALKAFVAVRALVHWACVRAGAHMPCRLPTQRTGGATRGPARAPAPFDASALSWS